ncbi:ABC transporter permease [Infirmifilum lucidum]|uniref:ABC transporter permease n=1 Tax=Infirmifilum lucidum TaxID=2776706 RepID=A0A7L9FGB8_9CREN|nr:FtsX-like permease family protein [Infirmifilum lucidum]QOJ78747.1 ABC transporter permease [Infirmifilum lucidum]
MNPSDYLYLALTSIKEKRGRAIGAIIGVMIAVVALSAALGIGESFQENFVEELQRTIAANSIIVTGGYAGGFTDADIAYFKKVPGVRDAFGIATATGTVITAGGEQPVTIVAIDPQHLPVYLGVSDMSRAVEEGSLRPSGLGVLVSNSLWRDPSTGQKLLDLGSPLIVRVRSKDVTLVVVGLMRQTSTIMGGHAVTNQIYMDSSTYFTYISNSRSYSGVIILVSDLKRLDDIVSEVRALAPPGSNVISAAAMVRQFTSLVNALQMFIALISAVGIGVTALWIFDSTTISVVQRTKEIGILKALGYTSRDVLLIFLLEVVIVSAIGIAGGVLISLVLSLLVKIPMFTFEIGLTLAPHVLAVSSLLPLAMNVLAAYIPSRRGSSLNPVEALRYE